MIPFDAVKGSKIWLIVSPTNVDHKIENTLKQEEKLEIQLLLIAKIHHRGFLFNGRCSTKGDEIWNFIQLYKISKTRAGRPTYMNINKAQNPIKPYLTISTLDLTHKQLKSKF